MARQSRPTAPADARRLKRALAALAVAASCGLAVGCAPDSSDLQAYIASVKARPSAPIAPIPEMKPFDSFVYSSDGLRDPFVAQSSMAPQAAEAVGSGLSPDRTRPRELLEEFPLDSLRMMGTLQQQNKLWALVKDPGGTIHRIRTGNYLGTNYGRVVRVDEQRVELVEVISNSAGGWIERDAALAIQE